MRKNPLVKDVTVDVQILIIAVGKSSSDMNSRFGKKAIEFMDMIKGNNVYFLAMDSKGLIKDQYKRDLEGTFGMKWLEQMAKNDKVKIVTWKNINHADSVALQEEGFHFGNLEDRKYVVTAWKSICGVLISLDSNDYTNSVREVLRKKLKVYVYGCDSFMKLCAG